MPGQFFLHVFNMLLTFFQFFWHVSGTKTFWCPSGGYKIVLLSFGAISLRSMNAPQDKKFLISLRTNALLQAKNKPKQPSGQKGKSHQNIHCTLSILQSQSIASAFDVSPYNLLKIYRLRNFSCASALFSYFLKFIVKIYYDYLVGVFTCVSQNVLNQFFGNKILCFPYQILN